jgi:hypothetical protein
MQRQLRNWQMMYMLKFSQACHLLMRHNFLKTLSKTQGGLVEAYAPGVFQQTLITLLIL